MARNARTLVCLERSCVARLAEHAIVQVALVHLAVHLGLLAEDMLIFALLNLVEIVEEEQGVFGAVL